MNRMMKFLSRPLILTVLLATLAACGKKPQETGAIHPEWSYNAVLYELNTRQFTPEGTFNAAATHIGRLADLGIGIIWFMPVQPIGVEERKGELGSYYSIYDYTAVNPEFGTMEDFTRFVDEAHAKGMRVILDWVANHTSRDARWIREGRLDWYSTDSLGRPIAPFDWSDVAKLDYGNPDMREAMTEAMLFWIREARIDGFRCDVADEVPIDFWKEVIPKLREVRPDLFMLAEAENPRLHEAGFDMTYAWELHNLMNRIAQGGNNAADLWKYLARDSERFPASAFRMLFTSNHDENSWKGTEFERMGNAAKTFAAMTYILPGMPLIYNGQEVGFNRRLEFFTKDRIDWVPANSYTELYTRLNAMRRGNRALWSGEKGGETVTLGNNAPESVFSAARISDGHRVVAIFNLSADTVQATVDLTGVNGRYTDFATGKKVKLKKTETPELAPWEFRIYVK